MNLQQRQSLPRLWVYSFTVANRTFPKLAGILLAYVMVSYAIYQILQVAAMPVAMFLTPLFMSGSKVGIILTTLALVLVIWGLIQLYSSLFITLATRMIGQEAQQQKYPLLETVIDSLKPAFFAVIAGILVSLPALLIYVPLYFVLKDANPLVIKSVDWLIRIILFFILYLRIVYAQPFIVLKSQGPIAGLVQSWRMTRGMKYLDTLLMLIMFGATVFIYVALLTGVLVALYHIIPLHFATLFDLSHTKIGWIMLLTILTMLVYFGICQVWTFLFVTFLNRYYTNDGGAFVSDPRDIQAAARTDFIDLPAVEITPNPLRTASTAQTQNNNPLDLPMDPVSTPQVPSQPITTPDVPAEPEKDPNEITGMRPLGSFDKPNVTPAVAPPAQTAVAATPNEHPSSAPMPEEPKQTVRLSNADELEELEISQSSIATGEQDSNEISQHLNKVYTPSNENIVQHGDEDRMPTILFDDEMAKELEKTARQISNPAKGGTDQNPPDPDSVKISK